MVKLFGPHLPSEFVLALSGGADSMAALTFLATRRYRTIHPVFFHHGTENSERALKFLQAGEDELRSRYTAIQPLVVGRISSPNVPRGMSSEAYWRDERHGFFRGLNSTVVTGHHLDDQVENWFFTSIHGIPRLMPYSNGVVVRPFLLNSKDDLKGWCVRNDIPWIEDTSNEDLDHPRNRIRKNIVPEIEKISKGFRKVMLRRILAQGFNLSSDGIADVN